MTYVQMLQMCCIHFGGKNFVACPLIHNLWVIVETVKNFYKLTLFLERRRQ